MEQQLCSEQFLMRPSSSSINAVDEVLEEVAAATTTILFCPDVVILCYEFIQCNTSLHHQDKIYQPMRIKQIIMKEE
jgi:hypothetical protein